MLTVLASMPSVWKLAYAEIPFDTVNASGTIFTRIQWAALINI